jgi:hypothetical protein
MILAHPRELKSMQIRSSPTLQRWTPSGWENIGGGPIAEVEGPSLAGADLQEMKLDAADLRQADLRGTNLLRAHLFAADLSGADLTGACLRSAVLMGVNLRGAVLADADLAEASLAGAHLEGADLRSALLEEAKLQRCFFDESTQWPEDFDPWERGAGPSESMQRRVRGWIDSGMTPEEYAGRHGHTILVSSATKYHYRDPESTGWMRRLGEILADPQLLLVCQQRFLTESELAEIRQAEVEPE